MEFTRESDRNRVKNGRLPVMHTRVTPELNRLIETTAASTGVSTSEFLRRAAAVAVLEAREPTEQS